MNPWILVAVGIVLMIAGCFVRPAHKESAWSALWGFATNSTVIGKILYVGGGILLLASIPRALTWGGSKVRELEYDFSRVTVVAWEPNGVLDIEYFDGDKEHVYLPEVVEGGKREAAAKRWPAGAKIYVKLDRETRVPAVETQDLHVFRAIAAEADGRYFSEILK